MSGGAVINEQVRVECHDDELASGLQFPADLSAGGSGSPDLHGLVPANRQLQLQDRAIRAVSQGVVITDPKLPDNPIVYASPSFERITGYSAHETLGQNLRLLFGKNTDPESASRVSNAVHLSHSACLEVLCYRKDGTPFWNEVSISPVFDEDSKLCHFLFVQNDVTERRQLEERFRQAQKMEAVGQLAGGIAHDFNNLMTIVLGYAEKLQNELPPLEWSNECLSEILRAGKRAASLTGQLLAFSRRQMQSPEVVSLNSIVSDVRKMLQRVLGEDILLQVELRSVQNLVEVDPTQIEQVLLNLAINARDAMPQGGRLDIRTEDIDVSQPGAGMRPGKYVLLNISDTGTGMSQATIGHIFEPFYTTKPPGKGTGLGLAVVHGIVTQSRGYIEVQSKIGCGATFQIYLPSVGSGERNVVNGEATLPRGRETVLVVEDEPGVRKLVCSTLRDCGYNVLSAADADEALAIWQDAAQTIDLLVTDVVMPRVNGRALAECLTAERPDLKTLYISGCNDDAVLRYGVAKDEVNFISKPFLPATLAQRVRTVLNGDLPQYCR